ncbi:ribosomal protein S18-alanine N-acetyltransferase [Sphingomonas piscis]|uniref:Ribosomal protein S18-alanine N-acetyltransferase n=1 Tax=Sphingomonas piscis TaxID=2714943 RepID=A0A6G7YNC0_9SPHN|nr:ribosomal protein S18-alanine N-acetyltransferase [Sphingomonas piscis]QIK78227.1 ribosomal protein S18-alanine N-acetyltransferase [Sphingomonas piscis]
MIDQAQELRDLQVDEGSVQDLDEVMAVMNAAFDMAFGEAWTRAQCAGILPMSGVSLRIARTGPTAVGFSLFRIVADEAELLLLAVDPAHGRKGIGRSLLEDFVASSKARGASKVHLEVRANNQAIQLYNSADFVPVGRRANYYTGADGSRFDALTLARPI